MIGTPKMKKSEFAKMSLGNLKKGMTMPRGLYYEKKRE